MFDDVEGDDAAQRCRLGLDQRGQRVVLVDAKTLLTAVPHHRR